MIYSPSRFLITICVVFLLAGCGGGGRFSTPYAAGYSVSKPISCVPYARDVSKFNIRGDAHTWWHQAAYGYGRGHVPVVGSVLVLSKTQRLQYGHVAVVTRILGPRHIDVTHSNWGSDRKTRSIIYERMRVEDISQKGDWSLVRFWNHHTGGFGSPYPASGFIYK